MRYHKLPRLFVEEALNVGSVIKLPKHQSHYLISVMRRKLSDNVILFNGKEGEFLGEIVEANKNAVVLKIVENTREQRNSGNITLIYSPVKNVKDEFIIQKATELGVSKIQPCVFERTVKPKVKFDKLKTIAIEAAEQCERLDIPELYELKDFKDIKQSLNKDSIIIFCDETGKGKPASEAFYSVIARGDNDEAIHSNKEALILIGPEGGFADSEIEQVYSLPNTIGIGLGPRILRADTAIITALALTQNYIGDFDQLPDFRNSSI